MKYPYVSFMDLLIIFTHRFTNLEGVSAFEVNDLNVSLKNPNFINFFENWISNPFSVSPNFAASTSLTYMVISNSLHEHNALIMYLNQGYHAVISGLLKKELRKKHHILNSLTVIISISGSSGTTGTNTKSISSSSTMTLNTVVDSIAHKISEYNCRKRDSFLFISSSEDILLKRVYHTKVVDGLRDKMGYALDTSRLYVDPLIYNNGTPVPVQISEISRRPAFAYNLRGRHFRMSGCPEIPPYQFFVSKPPKTVLDGAHHRIFAVSAVHFNFTVEIIYREGEGYGTLLQNGTWTGMIGNLIYPERGFDFAIALGHLYSLYDVFDFASTCAYASIIFAHGQQQQNSEIPWQALLYPFKLNLWILIGLAYFTVSGAIALILFLQQHNNDERNKIYLSLAIPYMIAMEQTIHVKEGLKTVAILWLTLTIITGTAYRSNLVSFLTFPIAAHLPRTFSELAGRRDYKIMLNTIGAVEVLFLESSESPTIREIHKRIHILERGMDKKCIHDSVIHEKTVCVGWFPYTKVRAAELATVNVHSESFVMSRDAALFSSISVPFQKYSIFTDSFSPIITAMFDTGIYAKWEEEIIHIYKIKGAENAKKSLESNDPDSSVYQFLKSLNGEGKGGKNKRSLKLKNLLVVFVILIFGLISSVVSFIGEISSYCYAYIIRIWQ
ncbi:unnamed protein product [Orchesella dallaii]|uniref:Ionotropic glutamate receptor C-terminal domain-containing protein n=1 Tax=Orchesella dallaii TaxID=48710 RepID=A0ABP1S1B3_9HEXA